MTERPAESEPVRRLVIAGGGSAGWMAAAAAATALQGRTEIVLVESEAIGIVGVGEATIPAIHAFNQFVGLDEAEFVKATQGSFKLGIEFVDWLKTGHRYFHPFGTHGRNFDWVPLYQYYLQARARGDDTPLQDYSLAWLAARENRFDRPDRDPRKALSTLAYAYHFDAVAYGQYLSGIARSRGVRRIEGKIVEVLRDGESGDLTALRLESGERVEGDFFLDCTGFRGLLIEQTLETGYEDWRHLLPCDRAIAAPCEHGGDFTPYTRSTAREAGWQWRIPLQNGIGNGYVHCSEFIGEDEATDVLKANLDGALRAEPRVLRFVTGRRRKAWNRNCVAIGLAAGFMEPLESTSLHLIQTGIMRFLALFPSRDRSPALEREFNELTRQEWEAIRDFLVAHYVMTEREDTPFWRHCRAIAIPDSLAYRLEYFRETGKITVGPYDMFQESNWMSVLLGQGLVPRRHDPLAAARRVDGASLLAETRRVLQSAASKMPTHRDFVERHCKAPGAELPAAGAAE